MAPQAARYFPRFPTLKGTNMPLPHAETGSRFIGQKVKQFLHEKNQMKPIVSTVALKQNLNLVDHDHEPYKFRPQ